MRKDGTLYYLLGDQLGSTVVISDIVNIGANKVGELRYKPWGESRYAWGSTPADRQYTGQISESALGLYFYNARFYDPTLGRFISPDTIISDPYNPLDWDRYSYVRNNPINNYDPDGHKSCELESVEGTCGWISGSANAIEKYRGKLLENTNIELSGDNWNITQVAKINTAVIRMTGGIDNVTGGHGQQWIRKNLGGSSIYLGGAICNIGGVSCVVGSTVHLLANFENLTWASIYGTPENMIIHEFGHVFDNRMQSPKFWEATWNGGGPSEALMNFIGAKKNSRFFWSTGMIIPGSALQFKNQEGFGYGNNSVADYFAHSFTAAIVAPTNPNAPYTAVLWVSTLIDLTK